MTMKHTLHAGMLGCGEIDWHLQVWRQVGVDVERMDDMRGDQVPKEN